MWAVIFLIFGCLVHEAASQKIFQSIDAVLLKQHSELERQELILRRHFSDVATTPKEANRSLVWQTKSINSLQKQQISDLKNLIDDVTALFAGIATTNFIAPYTRFFTCMELHRKLADLSFYVHQHAYAASSAQSNATHLTSLATSIKQINAVVKQPQVNLLLRVIENATALLTNHSEVLIESTSVKRQQISMIQQLFRGHCRCQRQMPQKTLWNASDTVSATIRNVEVPLARLQSEILATALHALKVSATAGSRVASFLANLQTADDYAKTSPNTSIASCGDLSEQIGFMRFKVANYENIREACCRNVSALEKLDIGNSSNLLKIGDLLSKYQKELLASMQYTTTIVGSMLTMLDHFCTCELRTKTTTQEYNIGISMKAKTVKKTSTVAPTIPPAPASGTGHACVLWTRYLGDTAPYVNGFSAGLAADDSQAFVARVFTKVLLPARVQITKGGGRLRFGNSSIANNSVDVGDYLVLREGCACKWIKLQVMKLPKGTVLVDSGRDELAIARREFLDDRVEIAGVSTKHVSSANQVQDYIKHGVRSVLVCESGELNGAAIVKSPNRACAYWAPYALDFAPSKHGLVLGLSAALSVLYIGQAKKNFANEMMPARIHTHPVEGGYVIDAGGGERIGIAAEFLLITSDCYCWFADCSSALKRVGVVRTLSNIGFGRRKLQNRKMALTNVDIKWKREMWNMQNNSYAEEDCEVMLVCEVL